MNLRSLSEQFRPREFSDLVGQERWLNKDGIIQISLHEKKPRNLLIWGPPGSGKTSFATLYLHSFDIPQAVIHPSRYSIPQIKEILDRARNEPLFQPTLLWIDEIHRLTRPQQDILLQSIEDETICLISATTENPSFTLSQALLSRLHTLTFTPLDPLSLSQIISRVTTQYAPLSFSKEVSSFLIESAQGDARKLLSFIDPLAQSKKFHKHYEKTEELVSITSIHTGSITSHGEGRYILISALHKSIRGSDVQASLYWLARVIRSGEDMLYILRRLIRIALEDIGLADPEAVQICLSAQKSYKTLGSPEGDLALFQAVIYLALSPKSCSSYRAMKKAIIDAEKSGHTPPPPHIINAPTAWMQKEGFGKGYIWDHEAEDGFSGQNYFPENREEPSIYYEPIERGFERELARRYHYFSKLYEKRRTEEH